MNATSEVNPIMLEKVSKAAKIILGIPNFLGENDPCAEDYIWKRLEQLGIYKDSESHDLLMNDCSEGEARRAFCENGEPNLPPVRFKKVWSILRGTSSTKDESTSDRAMDAVVTLIREQKPIGQKKDQELLESYGPDCDSDIVHELEKRSNNRPFVIFSDEETGSIDFESSLKMLREARHRETPEHYKVGDSLKRVYGAGEFPSLSYCECPLHPGVLLVNGYCDEDKASWDGVAYDAMQFIRIAKELNELPIDKTAIRHIINIARIGGVNGVVALKPSFPETEMVFNERKRDNELPNLTRRFSKESRQVSDPFINPSKKRY